jgi:hypothetical protein
MKKADNFDSSKWLVENKITFQSRLNEDMAKEKMYEVTVTHKITKRSSHVNVIATSEEEARKNVENSGMKLEDYYISSVVELYSEDLNENKIPGVNVEVDDDIITLSGDSGDYDGFIEDNGTVSFTVTNDEEEFNDQNWKDILGDDHAFVKIANSINTDVEALGDYVMITVKADDLTNMNESRLNEVIKDEMNMMAKAIMDYYNHIDGIQNTDVKQLRKDLEVILNDRDNRDNDELVAAFKNVLNQPAPQFNRITSKLWFLADSMYDDYIDTMHKTKHG